MIAPHARELRNRAVRQNEPTCQNGSIAEILLLSGLARSGRRVPARAWPRSGAVNHGDAPRPGRDTATSLASGAGPDRSNSENVLVVGLESLVED
jgi:hypothetical protein